jgi:hypothetical protein
VAEVDSPALPTRINGVTVTPDQAHDELERQAAIRREGKQLTLSETQVQAGRRKKI